MNFDSGSIERYEGCKLSFGHDHRLWNSEPHWIMIGSLLLVNAAHVQVMGRLTLHWLLVQYVANLAKVDS